METKPTFSAPAALERYRFETEILRDPGIGKWFLAVCLGNQPPAQIPDVTLALMESRGLVRKTEFGWVLGLEGRQFARELGLIPGPAPIEVDPSPSRRKGTKRAADIKDVWIQYKKFESESLRNQLMEHYLHLVRYNAERIHAKVPDEVELDDLMSAGVFGLMDAIAAFNPQCGEKFETFCVPRIRGMMLDELRSMDWVPSIVRSRAHKVTGAADQLKADLARTPTDDEIAKRLKLTTVEFKKLTKDATTAPVVSLSGKRFASSSQKIGRDIDMLQDKRSVDPIREIASKDLAQLLFQGLTHDERLIIILYYFEEMTMREIGDTLDRSESRVSSMHGSILMRLKAQMADRRKELSQAASV